MSKITLTAILTAADGKSDELEAALHDLIAAADEEDGLEVYCVSKNPNEPGQFVFFEMYTDEDAFAIHGKGDRMKSAMGALGGLLGGRPDVTILTPVAAKGLDL